MRCEAILFAVFLLGGFLLIDRTVWLIGFAAFVVLFLFELCFICPLNHAKSLVEKIDALEDRLKPRISVSCDDDEQCKLAAGERNAAHFRVRIHLSGDKIAEKVTATVIGIREDERKLPVTQPVKLRFHLFGIELPILRPETVELLDMFRLDPEGVSISAVIDYGAFNRFCCNNRGRTYEIDVEIPSTLMPARFTHVFPWTGDFNTTNPYIKQP